jgi:hypothetical protein
VATLKPPDNLPRPPHRDAERVGKLGRRNPRPLLDQPHRFEFTRAERPQIEMIGSVPHGCQLRGEEPGAMWRMLTSRADDLRIQLVEHDADETTGTAHWLADYTFTQTGRKVHNDVQARFPFADGLIAEHDDSFGFHSWARQALGLPGLLLGWTPIIQGPVRRRARAGLDEFMAGDSPRSDQTEEAIEDFAQGEAYGDDPLRGRRVEEPPPGSTPEA